MKILWRRDRLPTSVFLGFPCGSADKESACNAGDLGLKSLGWEDPLEKVKATHASILDWRIPWTIQSMGLQSQTQLALTQCRPGFSPPSKRDFHQFYKFTIIVLS